LLYGVNLKAQFGWSNTTGGDGEEVTYDATNKNIFYSTFQNLGGVMRNDVSTKISTYIGSPGQGDWTAPLVADPKLTNIVYAGTADLHKYNGTSWSILLDFATTDYMQPNSIAIAPSNSNIIYAYKNGRIYTTINGGTTWNNYAVDFGFTNMRVSPSNPSRVYISSWGSVYVSNDGGVTFSIMSGTLPGLNFGALAIHSATEEYIYVGSDNGNLFYKTYTSTDWNSIGAGIPSVTIRDIEVSTTNNKLLVGTYARGIFQGNLIGQSVVNSCPDPEWVSTTAYSGGAKVSYNGNSYSAKWWTQNNQPDLNTGEGKPWSLVGPCGAVNQPPLVTFTLPVKNSVFDQNVTVNLKADAIDSDGYVTKVEFLNSSDQVVFTDVSAPFEYPLTNLAVGLYVYKAKAYDNKNLASSVSTTNFEVKVLTPSITITSPTEGQIIKVPTGGKINVNVTTNPAVVDSVKFIIVDVVCNGPGCANVRRITSTVFPYSISYDPIVGSVSSQVNAIAFKNGIGSTITAVVNYNVVNLIAPIFAITSSLQGQTFYEYPSDGRKIDVTLTQQNATQAPIDSVIYRVQDIVCSGIVCTNTRTFKTSTAPFNINFDPSYTFYATAANTNTVIEATAYSKGVASEVKTLLLKVKPLPELTIVTPVNNVSVNKNLATIPIDVNVNSGQITIDSVVYTVYDTKLVGQTALTTTRKFNVQYPYDLDLPVVGGMNYTKVFALAYGNGGKFSRVQDIQINYNEVPTVYITDPSSSYKFNIGGSVTIKATVGDVDGTIAKVEIYSPHIANSKITLTAPPYEATFANLESSGMRGATSFVVVATDNQGGVNGASIDVAENKLPYIQVTSPVVVNSINPKYVVGGTITVAASIGDYDGTITKVEVFKGITNAGMVTLTAAPYSVNFTNLPAPFVDGSYSFKIKAYDSDGGVSEKLIVVYKNRIPSVTITSPVNNPNFNVGATIPISFLPYDPDWTSGKVEFFNGTTKLGEQLISGVLNGTAYTYNLSGLVAGNYNITVRATDDMNESGSANVSFTVGNSVCSVPAWSPLTAYNGATRVSKNGTIYEAKWWTQNNDPLTNSGQWDVWKIIGACNARLAEIESKVNVAYPNPFNNILNVSATVNSSLAQVYLLNLNGEVLFTNQVASIDGNITCVFETANLVSGIYIVKIVAGNDVTTYKVVK
jgi:chitodextrinase